MTFLCKGGDSWLYNVRGKLDFKDCSSIPRSSPMGVEDLITDSLKTLLVTRVASDKVASENCCSAFLPLCLSSVLPHKELRNPSQALHPPRLALWLVCPHGAVVKNLPAKAGDMRDAGLIPVSGRSLEKEMATHFSILAWGTPWREELVGYSLWGSKESNTTEQARTHASLWPPGSYPASLSTVTLLPLLFLQAWSVPLILQPE